MSERDSVGSLASVPLASVPLASVRAASVRTGTVVPKIIGVETEYANAVVGQGRGSDRPCYGLVPTLLRQLYRDAAATGTPQHTDGPRALPVPGEGEACVYDGDGESSPETRPHSPFHEDIWAARAAGHDFLPNGARAYEDHYHLEYSTQEVRSALDLVAAVRAGDRLVDRARRRAEKRLAGGPRTDGQRIEILANNVDHGGQTYAGHLNVLMDRSAFDGLFTRKPHLLYSLLIPYVVSIPIVTGAGTVARAAGARGTSFQLSQRAQFLDRADPSLSTTADRSLVNTRDEPLADPIRYARLHIITFDTNRQEYALYLKAGTVQLVVALLEEAVLHGRCPLAGDLALEDPLVAVRVISGDPSLRATVRLANGRRWTALDLQDALLEGVARYAETPGAARVVPNARRIADLWSDTIKRLRARDEDTLVRRLDWVAKLKLLERQAERLGWDDPRLEEVDLQYANVAQDRGYFHTIYEANGLTDRITSDGQVRYFMVHGPEDTRAYGRARLTRELYGELDYVSWDEVSLREGRGWWPRFRVLNLDDPLRFTKKEIDSLETKGGTGHRLFDLLMAGSGTAREAVEKRETYPVPARRGWN